MSRKSYRNTERFDYKIYSERGVKVPKETRVLARVQEGFESLAKMATQELVDETKLNFKCSRLLEEYELDLLFDISEIEAGISEIREAIEKYENIHVELKRELGDKYDETYPKFSENLKPMTSWFKKAKMEIKNRKVQKMKEEKDKEEKKEQLRKDKEDKEERLRMDEEITREREKADQLRREEELREQGVRKEKDRLRTAQKHLDRRIELTLVGIKKENSIFVEDMERNICLIRELMKEYSELFIKIEDVFGEDFQKEFHTNYETQNDRMYNFFSNLMNLCQETKHDKLKSKEAAEKLRALEQDQSRARENAEKIEIFKGIFSNVKERVLLLRSKCMIDLQILNDSDLQKYKDLGSLDGEFSEILDRVTELVKSTPPDFNAKQILGQARNGQEKLKNLKLSFQEKLINEVKSRDLTEEKMKNASVLGIKLPKFKGYDSSIDYYTFKSEFEKLIVPRVQAKLLPDYLKNNYLDGQALQLVKEIDDLDKIWNRLKLSFGNVNTLLANKLKVIESSDPLWKLKSDEKIVQCITKVKNLMMELTSLAEKHNIEASLFHSSNLAKIYIFNWEKTAN